MGNKDYEHLVSSYSERELDAIYLGHENAGGRSLSFLNMVVVGQTSRSPEQRNVH